MKRVFMALGIALGFVGASCVADGAAADGTAESSAGQFRIDANVVLINATVLGPHDRPVLGLTRDRFRVFEDNSEQSIAYFSQEEVPLSLAVIFDASGSMEGKLPAMRAALSAVLANGNPGDEFALITFSDRPQLALGWTWNPAEIQNRLLDFSAHGQTSLLDAVRTGLACLKQAKNARRAMLILSDGGDNHSRASERDILHSLEEVDVQIYAIDSTESWSLRTRSPEEILGPDLLERISDRAGGRYFQADSRRELNDAAEQISRELRSQYVIGYVPPSSGETGAHAGRFHHVRVQVKRDPGAPKLNVFWRKGYRASNE
jgi:Ca-activated chloride channel homolog